MKLKLKEEAGPTVDIGQGEYKRQFNRTDQPFKVDEAEAAMLLNTDMFEIVSPAAVVERRQSPRKEAKE